MIRLDAVRHDVPPRSQQPSGTAAPAQHLVSWHPCVKQQVAAAGAAGWAAALAVLQVLLLPLLLLLLLLLLAALVVVSVDAVVERVQAAVPVAAPVGALVAVMVVVQRGRLAVLAVEVAGRAAAQVSGKFQKLHVEMPC
mmetsp:Transcript_121743/g.289440  ORF Transcript_121743/g.289440 Transcript_121743/m.289440 type:complete len:139 (+) Transcript_121743:429-845(+)